MLRLGESSGDLAGPLLAGAEQRERLETLRRRLLQAAAYPALLSLVLLALGALLAFFVLPRFAALYKSMGSDLPWLTRALLAVLHGLPWLLAVLLASAGLAWLWAARQGPAALRLRLHALILRLPLVGPLATEMLWGRAAGALRAQLAAGERVTQALRLAAEGAGNLQLAARLSATAQAVAEGSAVSAALHEAGAPAVLTKLARVGERSGDLAGLCGQAAVLLESRFERRLTRYSAMVEPVMILVAGLVVGVVVVALYLPIFQMGTLLR
jgi:type IV pilus assembly protein PilC